MCQKKRRGHTKLCLPCLVKPCCGKSAYDSEEQRFLCGMQCVWMLVLIIFGLGCGGLIALYVPAIETDVAAYIRLDHPQTDFSDAVGAAKLQTELQNKGSESQRRTLTPSAQLESGGLVLPSLHENHRHLTTAVRSRTLSTLNIFYSITSGDTIFTEDILREIKDFETKLQNNAVFQKACVKAENGESAIGDCKVGDSVLNYFYATITGTEIIMDGKGTLREIDTVLDLWLSKNLFYYADKDFSQSNRTSTATRSTFFLGYPLAGREEEGKDAFQEDAKVALIELYNEVLRPSMTSYKHIRVSWLNSHLYKYEIFRALQEDGYLAGGSFLFVFIYMWIYTTSFWLAFMGMTGIMLSFPISYMFFRVVLGVQEMMVLNFLAIFLMLGIGADDMFVFTDTWAQSAIVVPGQSTMLKDLSARLWYTWKKAGMAMFITTITTAGSFLSNLAARIGVIREFGMFMATCVIVNYIYVMTLFPLAIVFWESLPCFQKSCCQGCNKKNKASQKTSRKRVRATKKKMKKKNEKDLVDDIIKSPPPPPPSKKKLGQMKEANRSRDQIVSSNELPLPPEWTKTLSGLAFVPRNQSSDNVVDFRSRRQIGRRKITSQELSLKDVKRISVASLRDVLSVDRVDFRKSVQNIEPNPMHNNQRVHDDNEPKPLPLVHSRMSISALDILEVEGEMDKKKLDEDDALKHKLKREDGYKCLEICFHNAWAPLCAWNRAGIALIVVLLALVGVAVWGAITFLRPADSAPQLFQATHNLGHLEEMRKYTFDADISLAGFSADLLSGGSRTIQNNCKDNCTDADHGSCDLTTFLCVCKPAYMCSDCASDFKEPSLKIQPTTLSATIRGQNFAAKMMEIENEGGKTLTVTTGGNKPSWLSVPDEVKTKYKFDFGQPFDIPQCTKVQIPFTFSTVGTQPGFTETRVITFNTNEASVPVTFQINHIKLHTVTTLSFNCNGEIKEPIPQFNSEKLTYELKDLPFQCDTLNMTMSRDPITSNVAVNYGGAPQTESAPGKYTLGISMSVSTLTIAVGEGDTLQTYTITTSRSPPQNVASLAALIINAGSLTPVFSSDILQYTATVSAVTSSILVTPTTASGGVATVNSVVAANAEGVSVPLGSYGNHSVSITVTSQDGSATTTYSLLVLRSNPVCTGTFTTPIAGIDSVDCSKATQNKNNCTLIKKSNFDCTGTVQCDTDFSGGPTYKNSVQCSVSCNPSTAPAIDNAVVNCASAIEENSNCTITSNEGFSCPEVRITCTKDGYASVNECYKQCEPTDASQINMVGASSIDCSSAIEDGQSCEIVPMENFNCSKAAVKCINKDGTGTYEDEGVCTFACNGNYSNTVKGAASVVCSEATVEGSKCVVNKNENYDCANVTIVCRRDSNGYALPNGQECSVKCDGSSEAIVGGTVTCTDATASNSKCSVSSNAHYNCSQFERVCTPSGYNQSGACFVECDPSSPPSIPHGVADCSTATKANDNCSLTPQESHWSCDNARVTCDATGKGYQVIGNCEKRCDPQAAPTIEGATLNCSQATSQGSTCIVTQLNELYNCDGVTTSCTSNGVYSTTTPQECLLTCDPANAPTSQTVQSGNKVYNFSHNCAGATSKNSKCTNVNSTDAGYKCDAVELICSSEGTVQNGGYKVEGICSKDTTKVDNVAIRLNGTYNPSGNYTDLELALKKQIAESFVPPLSIDDVQIKGLFPGSIVALVVITWQPKNENDDLNVTNLTSSIDIPKYSVITSQIAKPCDPSTKPTSIVGVATINCDNKTSPNSQCTIVPKSNFDCSTLDVKCSPMGNYSIAGKCSATCSSGVIGVLPPGVKTADCTAATTGGAECTIEAESQYNCASLAITCDDTGTGSYDTSGSCVRECSGENNEVNVNGAIVNCADAKQVNQTCNVQNAAHYDCESAQVLCGKNGSYIVSGSCLVACSNSVNGIGFSTSCSTGAEGDNCTAQPQENFNCDNVQITCVKDQGYKTSGSCSCQSNYQLTDDNKCISKCNNSISDPAFTDKCAETNGLLGEQCSYTISDNYDCKDVTITCKREGNEGQFKVDGKCTATCDPSKTPSFTGGSANCSDATTEGSKCSISPNNDYDCTIEMTCKSDGSGDYQVGGKCQPKSVFKPETSGNCNVTTGGGLVCLESDGQYPNPISSSSPTCVYKLATPGKLFVPADSDFTISSPSTLFIGGLSYSREKIIYVSFAGHPSNVTIRWQPALGDDSSRWKVCFEEPSCSGKAPEVTGATVNCSDTSSLFAKEKCDIKSINDGFDCSDVSVTCMENISNYDTNGDCVHVCNGDANSLILPAGVSRFNCTSATSVGAICNTVEKNNYNCSGVDASCVMKSSKAQYEVGGESCIASCPSTTTKPSIKGAVGVQCPTDVIAGSHCTAESSLPAYNCSQLRWTCATDGNSFSVTGDVDGACAIVGCTKESLDQEPSLISIEDYALDSPFSRSKMSYKLAQEVSYQTKTVKFIVPISESKCKSKDLISDNFLIEPLEVGSNSIKIFIGDAYNNKTYTFDIVRKSLSNISTAENIQTTPNIDFNPSFKSNVLNYEGSVSLEVQTVQFTVDTSDSGASSLGADNPYPLPKVCTPSEAVAGNKSYSNEITIRVSAEDSSQTSYTFNIYRVGKECNPTCKNGGQCDAEKGDCKCSTDYQGPTCSSYCPKSCSANGNCDTTEENTKNCTCNPGYIGAACDTKVCPVIDGQACSGHGSCKVGSSDCVCDLGYNGTQCNEVLCPGFSSEKGQCSGEGTCNLLTGKCTCNDKFEGNECAVKKPFQLPLKDCAELQTVWGIEGIDRKDSSETYPQGTAIYDPSFNIKNQECQVYLRQQCLSIWDYQSELNLRIDYSKRWCVMDDFAMYRESSGLSFPVNESNFVAAFNDFLGNYGRHLKDKVGKSNDWPAENARITYIVNTYKINIESVSPALISKPVYDQWVAYIKNVSSYAPKGCNHPGQTSSAWLTMLVETEALVGAIQSMAISVGFAFVSIMLFTGNPLISFYVILCIVVIMAFLMAFITVGLQWTFGPIESICLTIFVGFSVDYVLHVAHVYTESKWDKNILKIRDALTTIGPSILSAAVTTIGGSIFLCFCQIYIFVQMGALLLANTGLSIIVALTLFAALNGTLGPPKKCCSWYSCCHKKKRKQKEDAIASEIELRNMHKEVNQEFPKKLNAWAPPSLPDNLDVPIDASRRISIVDEQDEEENYSGSDDEQPYPDNQEGKEKVDVLV